jgi:O-methyltransferase domain/Dimerisation domain
MTTAMSNPVSTGARCGAEYPDVGTAAGLLRFGNLFCDAKVLLTAVRLGLFTLLHDEPAPQALIRERLGLHGRGLSDFLRLLVAIGVLTEHQGHYRNAAGADQYLVEGRPGYVGGFLFGADASLYPAYGNLAEALRSGSPQTGGEFSDLIGDRDMLGQFVQMMDGLNTSIGVELATAFDWSAYHDVLDVGGCRGNLAGQLLAAHPGLRAQVFDLPPLEPFFDERMAQLGLTDRARFRGGDFFRDELPAADVVIYGHVLSDWDPPQRQTLLHKAFAALPSGGVLLAYDRMLHPDRDDVENLVASLNMLLVTKGGGEYTVAELAKQATLAGFGSVTHQPLDAYDTLVICPKP